MVVVVVLLGKSLADKVAGGIESRRLFILPVCVACARSSGIMCGIRDAYLGIP